MKSTRSYQLQYKVYRRSKLNKCDLVVWIRMSSCISPIVQLANFIGLEVIYSHFVKSLNTSHYSMLTTTREHVSSGVSKGHPLLGNRLVYLLCSSTTDEKACSRCYTLQKAHRAADLQHPSARRSFIPANSSKININNEFIPSGRL